ncbi:MAG: YdcF family protein [Clostridia bacterium]|nr:YdcF family protein [Clostridia bacterium]
MKNILTALGWGRIAALLGCGVLLAMAFFFKFMVPGYSFTALVCLLLAALILFYGFFPLLGAKFPKFTKLTLRLCTAVLCAGLVLAGITEALIIRHSFGDPREQVGYMVVLGAKVRSTGPSVSLWDRIYGARDYLQAHEDVIAVVSGGQGPDEPMTEARAMYDALVELGIDPDRIWLEEQATSTWENITYSLDLIEEKTGARPEKIGVLSSEYHLFRASLLAKKCGAEFVGIPAETSRFSQKVNHFMREIAGVWHYLILGGQYE